LLDKTKKLKDLDPLEKPEILDELDSLDQEEIRRKYFEKYGVDTTKVN
jgi:hypothetical protein